MQMRDAFARVWPIVDDQPVAGLREAKLFCNLRSFQKEVSKQGFVPGGGVGDSRDWFARDDKDMHGRLWPDVMKRHNFIVLIDNPCGQLAVGNLLEKGFAHRSLDGLQLGAPVSVIQSAFCIRQAARRRRNLRAGSQRFDHSTADRLVSNGVHPPLVLRNF